MDRARAESNLAPVMVTNVCLSLVSACCALFLWGRPLPWHGLALGFAGLGAWQFGCAIFPSRRKPPVMLRLGGFTWTREDFCRGWLITGETGSGKTLGGVNTMLWEVIKNCPDWGGVCVDDKGLYAETLSTMLAQVGRRDDLIVLEVRPEGAPPEWKPAQTFNFLADPYLPYSGKAKIVCDVAAAQGQRSDQTFFRTQAQVQIEFACRVLAAAKVAVTLETTYDLLMSDARLKRILARLAKRGSPA